MKTFGLRMAPFRSLILLECAAISFFVLLFSAFILAGDDGLALGYLEAGYRIDAIEHERLSGIMIPVELGLGLSSRANSIGHLPAWNPYIGTGTPLINNGFFYLFNPFMSLPMLLLGAVQGGKVAIVLGLLMAGYSMWALGRAAGLGSLARMTVAALYALNGGMLAKLAAGHFQLGLSLVWPPLIIAALLWTLRYRQRRWPVLMAVAFALLFFSGNIYYSLHIIICCIIITLVYVLSRREGRWQIDRAALGRVAVGALLALGLTMIQFLPVWLTRDYVSHDTVKFDPDNGQLEERIDLGLNFGNFVLPEAAWTHLESAPYDLLPQVHYNYIGPVVFLLIGLLAVIAPRRSLRPYHKIVGIAFGLALLMMIWGAGQTSLLNWLYMHLPLLDEFRFLARANAIAGMWWILLAGIALEVLWRILERLAGDRVRLMLCLIIPVLLWGLFLVYSLSNNATRLALSLYNLNLFNLLNERRFANYAQATDVLLQWILLALVIDLLVRLVIRLRDREGLLRWLYLRGLRTALLLLAILALVDLIRANESLFQFKLPEGNFGGLYAEALSIEAAQNRLPVIQEPHTPSTYDVYYSRVRTWGLHEGWIPLGLEADLIPENRPKLVNMPRWAIVSNEFGQGAIYTLSRQFVEDNDYILTRCIVRDQSADDPCDLENDIGSALYQLPTALPYSFVASQSVLQSEADTLNGENARPSTVLAHDIDSILIQATGEGPQDYLVVRETHFPGWQAEIDGQPVPTISVGYQIPSGNPGKFIGVPMQNGTHLYTLRFYAPGFNTGAILSGLTLILLLLYLAGVRPPRLRRSLTLPVNPQSDPS